MRAGIGRVGVWATLQQWPGDGAEQGEVAAELEELGFGAVWLGNGPAILDVAASLLAATRRIAVATGIANIWVHEASAVATRAAALARGHPGRFVLGLGSGPRGSDPPEVSPHEKMVGYLDELDRAGIPARDRVLAALGPRALALAAARSAGAHPFLVTPEHTREAREILGAGPLLAPEQRFVLESDPVTARAIARQDLAFYLPKRGYARTLLRLGFAEDDLARGGSDRLVDALVPWGDLDTVLVRVDEHLQAGADHVALQPLTPDTHFRSPLRRLPREEYRRIGEALGQ